MDYDSNHPDAEPRCRSPPQPVAIVAQRKPLAARPGLDELLQQFRSDIQRPRYACIMNNPYPWDVLPCGKDHSHPCWNCRRRYMTQAGFRVRSKAEKIIADYLTRSELRFVYEPLLRVGKTVVRPDFYLTDYDLPYEHFGLSSPEYLRDAERRIVAYYRAGVPFIYTTFNDEPDIEDAIVDRLFDATE
jgi:hypothetical protein